MDSDRRKDRRYRYTLEVRWHAVSGHSRNRVSDISKGGSFVESLTAPAVGERTELTLLLEDLEITLWGCIRHVEPGIGFSVEFEALQGTATEALDHLVHRVRMRLTP